MSSTDGEQRMATILEVNMGAMRIVAQDDYGTTLYISLQLNDPLIAIPITGERWLIERQGIDWFLEKRADNGSEIKALSSLNPGDRRIEAAADLHLNGKNVFVNGSLLSTEPEEAIARIDSDRILAPMNAFFTETTLTPANGSRYISRFTTVEDFTFTRLRYICNTKGASSDLIDIGVFDHNCNMVVNSGPIGCAAATGLITITVPKTTLSGNRSWFTGIAYSGGGILVIGGTRLLNAGSNTYSSILQDDPTINDQYFLGGVSSGGYPLSTPTPASAYAPSNPIPIIALLP